MLGTNVTNLEPLANVTITLRVSWDNNINQPWMQQQVSANTWSTRFRPGLKKETGPNRKKTTCEYKQSEAYNPSYRNNYTYASCTVKERNQQTTFWRIFYLFQETGSDISRKLSSQKTVCIKCQTLFSEEKNQISIRWICLERGKGLIWNHFLIRY